MPLLVKVALLAEMPMEVFNMEVLKGDRESNGGWIGTSIGTGNGCFARLASVRLDIDKELINWRRIDQGTDLHSTT